MDIGAGTPEVCFLGRSNVGKSSLLNALLGKQIARASARLGRTRLMNAFAVGDRTEALRGVGNGLVVMDMPGYGKGAQAEWGVHIMKYLEKRRQLKRVFLLIDAEHSVKETDKQIIKNLQDLRVPFQVVLSKVDRVLLDGKRKPGPDLLKNKLSRVRETMEMVKHLVQPDGVEDEGSAVGEVLACCSQNRIDGKPMGIDRLRFAVLRAAGLQLMPKVKRPKVDDGEIVSFEEILEMEKAGPVVDGKDPEKKRQLDKGPVTEDGERVKRGPVRIPVKKVGESSHNTGSGVS